MVEHNLLPLIEIGLPNVPENLGKGASCLACLTIDYAPAVNNFENFGTKLVQLRNKDILMKFVVDNHHDFWIE